MLQQNQTQACLGNVLPSSLVTPNLLLWFQHQQQAAHPL